jgi:hypothetical protein
MKAKFAIPPTVVTADGGVKEPFTPVTESLTVIWAPRTVAPLASCTVAAKAIGNPVCERVVCAVKARFFTKSAGPEGPFFLFFSVFSSSASIMLFIRTLMRVVEGLAGGRAELSGAD